MASDYKIGSYVYYNALGICEVKEFVTMGNEQFIVLQSVNKKNPLKIFVPLNNQEQCANINDPLTAKEVKDVLSSDYKDITWNTNKRERQEQFNRILRGDDFVNIISLILCLDKRNKELRSEKKRLSTFDGEVFKKACRLCEETIAHAFDISMSDANDLFVKKVALDA